MTRIKFIGMIMAAKIPNDLIGMSLENADERKAIAVVLEVTSMALASFSKCSSFS